MQAAQVFAVAATGTLSAAKVWQIIGRRKKTSETHQPLFPPDERDQVIRAIDDLKRESRARYNEYQDLKTDIRKIADHLGIDV